MATPEQRRARAAQRATARQLRSGTYRPTLPPHVRQTIRERQLQYARDVQSGKQPMPSPGTPESKQLARMASLSYWNKADPSFLASFQQFFYHRELASTGPEDDE